jgi:phenylpyruvate tautomerase PptA (4-oxalocrotonate tautomerase family)
MQQLSTKEEGMPWVNVNTAKSVSTENQASIKSGVATILLETLDKQERGLNVTFVKTDAYYRAGESCDDAAAVDIRYIGTFALEKKQVITRRVCKLLEDSLSVDPKKIIVLFSETDSQNWGRNQGDFQ